MTATALPIHRRPTPSPAHIDAARKAAAARRQLQDTDCGTRAMNSVLTDIATFDQMVKDGILYTTAGRLELHLSLGGLRDVDFDGNANANYVRAAIAAYGDWLRLVAVNAL